MRYRFYDYDAHLEKRTIYTRSGNHPVSVIAQMLRELAFQRFGHDGYIVHDGSLIGGYYRNSTGNTVAVEPDFSH